MAIDTTSRLYQDNFRAMRRYLQGRGVNLRQTIVTSSAVYATDRIVVPGMHADDKVISVIDWTDGNDATGYLDVDGTKATLSVFATNKGINFTAVKAGPEGNKIYVKAQAAAGNSLPLSVTIGDYDTVLGTTGHPGKTVILVELATNGAGAALTDGTNSAAKVLVAIIDAMETQPAVGGNGHIVDVALAGNGSTDWTATGPTALSGGAVFNQGPAVASLRTALSPYTNADIKYTARARGANGNNITVAYTAGGALAVGVTGTDIVVTYVVGVTTAADVIAAVNADVDASALVLAAPAYGPVPSGTDVSGVIETMAATPLTGGLDPGIQLSVASNAKKLLVVWLTHDEIDEN